MFGRKEKEPVPEGIVTSDEVVKEAKEEKVLHDEPKPEAKSEVAPKPVESPKPVAEQTKPEITPPKQTEKITTIQSLPVSDPDGAHDNSRIRKYLTKKNLLIAAGVFLLLEAGIVFATYRPKSPPASDLKDTIEQQDHKQKAAVAYQDAVGEELTAKNYASTQATLQTQADALTSAADKGLVYMQMASLALGLNKYQDSLTYSQKAEELEPTAGTARLIAVSSAGLGKNETAVEYYKKAISRMDPSLEMDRTDIVLYKKEIKKLGGTP